MLEEYIVKKDNLETIVRKEQKETVRQLEATGDTVEAVQSVIRNDLVESAKTRRQRARQTSEAKDYSVPKTKRGKNPPAVSDKPISDDALPKRKRQTKTKPEDVPVDPISKAKEDEISKLWKQYDGAKLRDNKALQDEIIQKIGFAYEAYRKDLTDLSIDDLANSGAIASDPLSASIDFEPITLTDTSFVVAIVANDYWKFVDLGVKGAKSSNRAPNSPFSYRDKKPIWKHRPPVRKIQEWIAFKSIPVQGRDKIAANRALAINISNKIWREGLRATNFMSNAVTEDMVAVLTENIAEVLGKSISVATVR